jgi:hypothetical protein
MIEPISPNETMIAEASSARRRPDESVELELLIRRAYDDKRATIKFALSTACAEELISNLTRPAVKSDTGHDVVDPCLNEDDPWPEVVAPGSRFRNLDVAVPTFTETPKPIPPRKRIWLRGLFLIAGVSLVFLLMYAAWKKDAKVPEDPPGWLHLLDCAIARSVDRTKELYLSQNSRAVLYDKSIKENGKYRAIHGSWAFDEATKRYTVNLNGVVTAYSLVELEDWGVCILAKGNFTSADLSESWFGIPSDGASDEPPEADY